MDVKLIERLIEIVSASNVSEFEYEENGKRIVIRKNIANIPLQLSSIQLQPENGVSTVSKIESTTQGTMVEPQDKTSHLEAENANLVAIKAPLVGTFYRAPSPDAPPYVKEGDVVEKGQVVCIIEAMKIMNEIESDVRGKVVKVLVENGKPVEYGQPLFLIEPL